MCIRDSAQAAQHMAESGDWVTLQVNGIRYLEKPPLPYWLDAAAYRVFGQNVFATHLPNALALLGCAWIGWLWAGRAWGRRAGLYAALGVLTSIGPFLFTRFAIPEALLSLLLLAALYCLLTGFETSGSARFYGMWAALALAVLTKGLIAPIFFGAAAIPLLLLSGQWRRDVYKRQDFQSSVAGHHLRIQIWNVKIVEHLTIGDTFFSLR